ncbi:MAG TPA: phosphatase PAP2 family protein, partial [Caulobacteraceae bacterium]
MNLLRRIEATLLLAIAALGGGLWLVLELGSEVQEGETGVFDRALLLGLRTPGAPQTPIGPRWVQESARDLTALGGFTVLTIVTVAAIAALLIYRRYAQAVVFGVTVVLAQLAAELIKAFIGRPRPDLVGHLDLTYASSFPSGHAVMSPVVYFTLALIIAETEIRR